MHLWEGLLRLQLLVGGPIAIAITFGVLRKAYTTYYDKHSAFHTLNLVSINGIYTSDKNIFVIKGIHLLLFAAFTAYLHSVSISNHSMHQDCGVFGGWPYLAYQYIEKTVSTACNPHNRRMSVSVCEHHLWPGGTKGELSQAGRLE